MAKNNRIIIPVVSVAISIIIAIVCRIYGGTLATKDTLFGLINELEKGSQMRSVILGVLFWMYGYLINRIFLYMLDEKWAALLAAPVFYTIWGIVSTLVVLLKIPYSRLSMLVIMLLLITGVMLYGRYGIDLKEKRVPIRWEYVLYTLAITIVIVAGVFPVIMSGDSYNYILKYGIIIANEGGVNFDSVGNYMAWTGISCAFFSSLGVFCEIENIQVFHYQLIISSILLFLTYIYEKNSKIKNRIHRVMVNIIFTVMFVTFPMIYIMGWIINNSYFVCIFVIGIVVADKARKGEFTGKSLIILLAMFWVWLCLSRIEAFTLLFYFTIIFSVYLRLQRKEYLITSLPMMLMELGFAGVVYYYNLDGKVETLYNSISLGVILISAVGIIIYGCVYENKIIIFIREHAVLFSLLFFLLVIVAIGIIYPDRLLTDVRVTIHNVLEPAWSGWVPFFIIGYILTILIDRKFDFVDICLWGFIIFNFCLCLGRPQDLRLGISDSYNRILMSSIPLAIIVLHNHVNHIIVCQDS